MAKVSVQLFIWKIIQQLINNNIGINCVLCAHIVNLLLPNPVFAFKQSRLENNIHSSELWVAMKRNPA